MKYISSKSTNRRVMVKLIGAALTSEKLLAKCSSSQPRYCKAGVVTIPFLSPTGSREFPRCDRETERPC
jgi:hypothetical protein